MDSKNTEKNTCTVTEAITAARRGLEQIHLTVVGEVSEFNDKPGYKAAYFEVHDDSSVMSCIMWRSKYSASGVQLRPGMLVELTGNFTCYTAKGRMQFNVNRLRMAGEGNLRMQVAQLARKLEGEGLMDPLRKRGLPALPQRIAVVTSPRGKAVHDVLRTLRRRYPLGEVLLFGVPVEGAEAPRHLRDGLQGAYALDPLPDVILLVRGGGSYEDLMPFNDEQLARVVAASPVPLVTGIGHEPDNSICDMVADRRCSTPTAAAEAVSLSIDELQSKVNNATKLLDSSFSGYIRQAAEDLRHLSDRPLWHDATYLTGQHYQTLDGLQGRLSRAIPDALARDAHQLALLQERLRSVGASVGVNQAHTLSQRAAQLKVAGPALVQANGERVALAAAKLHALSPLKTLARGYSITYAADGHTVIDSVEKATVGEEIKVQVQDGSVRATVSSLERR